MRQNLIRLATIVGIALILATAAFAKRKVECAGNLCIGDNGGISPSTLPRHEKAPVTARIVGQLTTRDGGHLPALRTVDLDVDRTIGVDAVGLPSCRAQQIEATSSATAKRICGRSIVGSGEAEVEVAFPEQARFSASGPVILFNGGVQGGTTVVLLHTYVAVPAPTAIVVKVAVKRIREDRYGLHIAAPVPRIAGGAGSVAKFAVTIGRRFTYKGTERSYLVASCPTGSWATRGEVSFDDGTRLGLTHIFPCTPKG